MNTNRNPKHKPRHDDPREACALRQQEIRSLLAQLGRDVDMIAAGGTWPEAGSLGYIRQCIEDASAHAKGCTAPRAAEPAAPR